MNEKISTNTDDIGTLESNLALVENNITNLQNTRLTKDNIIAGTNVTLDKNGNNITINASGGTSAVTSVNTKTGDVVLSSDDIKVGNTATSITTDLGNKLEPSNIIAGTNVTLDKSGNNVTINASSGTAPVTSVNSKTGAVVLTSDDIKVGNTTTSVTTGLGNKLETSNILEGENITLTKQGNNITISANGGSGGGISKAEVEEMISGTILFSQDPLLPQYGNVTLSDSILNYKRIIIEYNEYSYSSRFQYIEIYEPRVNKNVNINWTQSSRNSILIAGTTYTISSETVLHPYLYILVELSSSISRDASKNFIGISKVIGYKY